MKKLALISVFAAVAAVSNADLLYSNGPMTNGTSGANNVSIYTAGKYIGVSINGDAGNKVAEDFTVSGGNWIVDSICVLAHDNQTGNPAFNFTNANLEIRSGSLTGAVVFSGSGLAVSNAGFAGYRVLSTQLTSTQRPMYKAAIALPNVNLTNGTTYWVSWALNTSNTNGPFADPVTTTGPVGSAAGNSMRFDVAANDWVLNRDSSSLANTTANGIALAFEVKGIVPEPATMLALGAGAAALMARRRRK